MSASLYVLSDDGNEKVNAVSSGLFRAIIPYYGSIISVSSDHPAIRVRNPGKKYTIGRPQEKYLTLRDAIVNSVKAPFRQFHRARPSEEFWALKTICSYLLYISSTGHCVLL
ncbi:MAG: hypothetical protein Q7V05_00110 [Methanoregula sp.]|nr:hypothetical protein [Methanoregula sp.]